MITKTDVAIAGSGPAGLMSAITAAREGASVIVFEQKDRAASKLYATGNGRCNFTNLKMTEGVYRGGAQELAYEAVETFDNNDLIGFFNDLGLITKHIGDYVYPYNEQASAVVSALMTECIRLGVKVHTSEKVIDIIRDDDSFTVSTDKGKYECISFVMAPGGKASPAHGSDGNLNKVIRKLGHTIIPQEPALVPLIFSEKSLSVLAGVRLKCGVTLEISYETQNAGAPDEVYSEQGEIIFNRDNISGIPVMQLSRYAVCKMVKGAGALIKLDLFPEYSQTETYDLVKWAFRTWGDKNRNGAVALSLCVNEKLAEYIIGNTGKKAYEFTDDEIKKISTLLKSFPVRITGNAGFSRAQVTAGGVDGQQIDGETMGSRLCKGLYFCGEIIDTDGTCGGYNLHFAFASGRIAGRSAALHTRAVKDDSLV